ncbi:hypothetical protein M8J75_013538 [Diaphorina citri]|nr:hypothetical protein M8J75_013538 [Diaphorina citri]
MRRHTANPDMKYNWVTQLHSILREAGKLCLWESQDPELVKTEIDSLLDFYKQKYIMEDENRRVLSSYSVIYKTIADGHTMKSYLNIDCPIQVTRTFSQLRAAGANRVYINLKGNIHSWNTTELCTMCNLAVLETLQHVICECPMYADVRSVFLKPILDQGNTLEQVLFNVDCSSMTSKLYWDLEYDLELMTDPVGLDILYAQAVSDVHRESIVVHKDTKTILNQLEASVTAFQYVDLARKLKYYGFIEFEPCTCDFPKPNTKVVVNIGLREINFRIRSSEGEIREGTFKVTRMRCWKITINKEEDNDASNARHNTSQANQTQLSFEYLLAKNKLQWITIQSNQAILMSNLLQSIIDELVLKKTHEDEGRTVRNGNGGNSFYYMKRDGSSQITSPSISSTELDSNSSNGSNESRTSLRRSSGKLSSVGMKVMGKSPFVENDAFEGIGDDDL